jgi:diaminohydroxyphosphoribosylaminopyrimidine deaminase / 5-amino-6-(5-phosphoribosylamino)uracil reductase
MKKLDLEFMKKAVEMAYDCKPIREDIPKVAAIIVSKDGTVIGRGIRGDGGQDDEHAEHHAILFAEKEHRSKLEGATLYTTLEPCTPEVRSKAEKCCLKLIERNKISRVFVGILDPNQGVTGKGLLALQKLNIEINLFPHKLSRKIQQAECEFHWFPGNPWSEYCFT